MKRQQPTRYTSDQAALQWMRIKVRVSEPDVEQLLITVSLLDLNEAQRRACLPYLKGHRRHRLAVRTEDLGEWEQAHFRRDHAHHSGPRRRRLPLAGHHPEWGDCPRSARAAAVGGAAR
jgi:hypothetical protein